MLKPILGVMVLLFTGILSLLLPVLSYAQTATIPSSSSTAESFWTNGAPMPTPRTEIAAALLGDNIYLIGGFDKSGQVTDIVEVYNLRNDSWTRVTPIPQPLHHTSATSHNGKIYVVGGYTDPWIPTNKLFIYDPIQNDWQEGKPMPTARGALNANFINETLYAVGGSSDKPLPTNEAYDPSANAWTHKAAMPTARHHAASSVIDGKLYVIGGRISGSLDNIDVNEMYDPIQDRWVSNNLELMPSKRSGIAAASINISIYVFGGEEPSKTFNNNEKYDVKSNKWTTEPSMPTARHGLAAVAIRDKIYVIGGGPEPGLSVTNVNEIFHVR
jgi:N-acetylneuraminic acid mutarotase